MNAAKRGGLAGDHNFTLRRGKSAGPKTFRPRLTHDEEENTVMRVGKSMTET